MTETLTRGAALLLRYAKLNADELVYAGIAEGRSVDELVRLGLATTDETPGGWPRSGTLRLTDAGKESRP